MASTDTIADFWNWFSAHSAELMGAEIPHALIEQLEERLFAVHRLDWEIGPGRKTPNLFALSPRGDRATLKITREIIAHAPKLKGWSFYPAKPPRQWNLVFSLNVNGKEIKIDGKRWQFVAYKFDDGTFDLVFKPDNQQGLSADYLNWAAVIIVDGEVGEEKRMDLIGSIEIVDAWDQKVGVSAQTLELGLIQKALSS